jgi:hypothetical protein
MLKSSPLLNLMLLIQLDHPPQHWVLHVLLSCVFELRNGTKVSQELAVDRNQFTLTEKIEKKNTEVCA